MFQNLSMVALFTSLSILGIFILQQLSKPNVTQLNSTQLKATQKQLRWVRHSTHLEPTPPTPPHPPPTNFSGTSRLARELKFGIDTH